MVRPFIFQQAMRAFFPRDRCGRVDACARMRRGILPETIFIEGGRLRSKG
jgi:hypothetical protein